MKYDSGISAELNQDLPYDLRQIYAVEIVGYHLKAIMFFRKNGDYMNYYKSLKDLFIVVKHKIRDKKFKDDEGKDHEAIKYYNGLIEKANITFNLNLNVYFKKSKDPKGVANVEGVLEEIEMFLYEMIEKAKMFGGSQRTVGL